MQMKPSSVACLETEVQAGGGEREMDTGYTNVSKLYPDSPRFFLLLFGDALCGFCEGTGLLSWKCA